MAALWILSWAWTDIGSFYTLSWVSPLGLKKSRVLHAAVEAHARSCEQNGRVGFNGLTSVGLEYSEACFTSLLVKTWKMRCSAYPTVAVATGFGRKRTIISTIDLGLGKSLRLQVTARTKPKTRCSPIYTKNPNPGFAQTALAIWFSSGSCEISNCSCRTWRLLRW